MRRLLAWLLGGAGLVAAYRLVRRKDAPVAEVVPAAAPDPRADELRRRLDESRALVEERDEFESGEMPVDRAEPSGETDERRREVHDRAREAAERMRAAPPDA